MGAFDRIPEQKRAAAILQRSVLADRISHAWLFCGPDMEDMQRLALAFAQTLQCSGRQEHDADACMQCHSCRQAMSGNHPDILVWSHAKPKTFSVDEVRSLVQDVSVRPYQSERKVYIVKDAHLMRAEAQNALLKTLEEPPEYIVILLLSLSADAMLETVRSRCQMVELAAGQTRLDPQLEKTVTNILLQIHTWKLPQIKAAVKELAQYKDQMLPVFSLFTSWYRDVLYFKASMDPEHLLMKEHLPVIRTRAVGLSYEAIQHIIDSIQTAHLRLLSNVNFDLTMELLLLSMQDA